MSSVLLGGCSAKIIIQIRSTVCFQITDVSIFYPTSQTEATNTDDEMVDQVDNTLKHRAAWSYGTGPRESDIVRLFIGLWEKSAVSPYHQACFFVWQESLAEANALFGPWPSVHTNPIAIGWLVYLRLWNPHSRSIDGNPVNFVASRIIWGLGESGLDSSLVGIQRGCHWLRALREINGGYDCAKRIPVALKNG